MFPFLTTILPQLFNLFAKGFGVDTTTEDTKIKLAQMQLDAMALVNNQYTIQAQTNTAEANAPGRKWITWREMVGYTCAAALAYHFVLQQMLAFLFHAMGHPVVLPTLEISELMTILMGMLGLGGLEAGKHVVDSLYNSPPGTPPSSTTTKKPPRGEDENGNPTE